MPIVLTRQHALTAVVLIVSTCVAAVGALVGGELFFRHRERSRSSVPGTMPLIYYRHARLQRALVRDAEYFGWVHVNRHGFRGDDVSEEKKPGVLRIMAVGASTTFDTQVRGDSSTWPARLEYWLGQRAPETPVEVINAGVPSYGLLDAIIRLQTELYRFAPDLVVLYHGHNELYGAFVLAERSDVPRDTPDEVDAVSPWRNWLWRHSLLYTKLAMRFDVAQFRSRGASFSEGESSAMLIERSVREGERRFERDLTSFIAIAKGMGIPVALLEPVHVTGDSATPSDAQRRVWRQTLPFATPEHVLDGYRRYRAVIQRVGARTGSPVIATRSFGLTGEQWYADDDPIHFNDQGADRMAQRLADALLANRLLVPAPPANHDSSTTIVARTTASAKALR